jgi:hypothetical protein
VLDVAFPLPEQRYLLFIHIKARDAEPGPAELGHERQADIAEADDADPCRFILDFANEIHGLFLSWFASA